MFESVYKNKDGSCFMTARGLQDSRHTLTGVMLKIEQNRELHPTRLDLEDEGILFDTLSDEKGFDHVKLFASETGVLTLYNFCTAMCIHVINKRLATSYQASMDGMGHRASTRPYILHPQDEADFQQSVFMGVYENCSPDTIGQTLDMKEFSGIVASIAYLFHDKYAYRHNRTGMDISMDGYGTTDDGARVNLMSYDYLTEKRVNAQVERIEKNVKAMKDAEDTFNVWRDNLATVFTKAELKDFHTLYTMRANLETMSDKNRYRLKYLVKVARARRVENEQKAGVFKQALKVSAREHNRIMKENDKARRETAKLANREKRYETRKAMFLKSIGALLLKVNSQTKEGQALQALWIAVNAHQRADKEDDRALEPFRADFKALKTAIKGHDPKMQTVKERIRKNLKTVSV